MLSEEGVVCPGLVKEKKQPALSGEQVKPPGFTDRRGTQRERDGAGATAQHPARAWPVSLLRFDVKFAITQSDRELLALPGLGSHSGETLTSL